MAWAILIVAGLFEIGWAVGLKYTQGFTRLWPSVPWPLPLADHNIRRQLPIRIRIVGKETRREH